MSIRRTTTDWQSLTVEERRERALRAGTRLEGAPALEVLGWAAATFGDRWAVTTSFTDAVLPHLASRAQPGVKVVFVDTGYHFAETLGTRDAVSAMLPLTVINATAERTVAEQDAAFGKDLWARDPDLCCAMRKVRPLNAALAGLDAWASGLRRDESAERAGTPVVTWDEKRKNVKVNPLATWTEADVEAYIEEHDVLVNPLVDEGYPSIGCATCTFRVAPGEDLRAGRWAGRSKTECGIHA